MHARDTVPHLPPRTNSQAMSRRPPSGIEFPTTDDKGTRSTTHFNKRVFRAAVAAVPGNDALVRAIDEERKWRSGYTKHVIGHVRSCLEATPAVALESAQAGLKELHDSFEFHRNGSVTSLAQAMQNPGTPFHTGVIKGEAKRQPFAIPYKGKVLKGKALERQVDAWAQYGTIEPDTAESIKRVARDPTLTDLSDKYFVILGALSAMGPFRVLMALGANCVAIDLNRAGIWSQLFAIARSSPGTLTFPLSRPQSECTTEEDLCSSAGSDLIAQTPEILHFVKKVFPGKPLTVGCYVYLDGALHVKVSIACDAVIQGLCAERRDTSVAYLCTPTDYHVIPDAASKDAAARFSSCSLKSLVTVPARLVSGSRMCKRNVERQVVAADGSTHFSLVDGLLVPQGPNYALAKRLQHWRAIVSRAAGHVVSTNIAPSTATKSVMSNRLFAWAYDGLSFFEPYEVFQQDTSNAVMTALLLFDIGDTSSPANPDYQLKHPLQLFAHNGFHGGLWRCAHTLGSTGEISLAIHFVKELRPIVLAIAAFLIVRWLWVALA